jgi:hypothetical protein
MRVAIMLTECWFGASPKKFQKLCIKLAERCGKQFVAEATIHLTPQIRACVETAIA